MKRYLLTASGSDRKGFVALVSQYLYTLNCNLEDSSMTELQGEFAILLIFSTPKELSLQKILRTLKPLTKKKISLQIKPIRTVSKKFTPRELCLITVYGIDRPGLVYHITHLLTKQKVNITDLSTHRTEAQNRHSKSGYILYIEGDMPAKKEIAGIQSFLKEKTKDLGLTISVKKAEPSPL